MNWRYGLSFSVSDDHSRVKLQNAENDYINASLVDIEEAQRSYILTQASGVALSGGLTAIPGVCFRMEQKVCPDFWLFQMAVSGFSIVL